MQNVNRLTSEQHKILWLSSFGGLLEFYDFIIYGFFAMYFANQYFPTHDKFIALLASYSIFVVGYIVRPLGGILFSHIGDEWGRKNVLIITMVLMGISSCGMGALPVYQQIGIWAPCLMLLFRVIQGLAIGGELPSMIVYVAESMPKQRELGLGIVYTGVVAGILPGILINLAIVHYLTMPEVLSWGWRIPFFIGGIICLIAYFIRKELHETSAFQKIAHDHQRLPIIEVVRDYGFQVILGIGLISILATSIILAIVFMPTYLTKIMQISTVDTSDASLVSTVVSVVSVYFSGKLAQRYGVNSLVKICLSGLFIASLICYFLIDHGGNLYLALSIFALFQGALVSLSVSILSQLFPIKVRLSGVALAYNISFVIFGGLTPLIVTSLIERTRFTTLVPVLVLSVSIIFAWWAFVKSNKYLVED
jgi:MFS family permease